MKKASSTPVRARLQWPNRQDNCFNAADAEGRLPFLEWVSTEYDEAALKRDFVANGFSSFVTDRILQRE